MRALRNRLTYANVVATLALLIAVAGGTAYAANTIFSADIVNGEVKGVDIGNNQVRHADVRDEALAGGGLTSDDIYSLTSEDIGNETLTGNDITDQSGVDTCTHETVRFGELCVGVANQHKTWTAASNLCAGLELRLPSRGEAQQLAQNHDLPNVDQNEFFWTDEFSVYPDGDTFALSAYIVSDSGVWVLEETGAPDETVCVTTPTN